MTKFISKYNYEINPKPKPVLKTYELRYKINKFSYEVILRTFMPGLAYGMRKKLSIEQPKTYPLNKLIVKIL